ncbi:hypothetical protein C9374_014392 [Naegleria lovaniensis]|uniref:Uncharacterized protein n=1 Tax=Naegleria lovaniensis TaxID=51637 RepID=A0AA88KU57_NAELO|nr:uncharacterized protein C9374_014392 [Naegleria lovaniensis]KAG2388992.1 hypothetical protein C9374_014392 [Naegleria lovaniensis]
MLSSDSIIPKGYYTSRGKRPHADHSPDGCGIFNDHPCQDLESTIDAAKSCSTAPTRTHILHPLEILDMLEHILQFIGDDEFLQTMATLRCCNKIIARECLSEESKHRLWKDRSLNVTSKRLVDFVLNYMVNHREPKFSNYITSHSKLKMNVCKTLDTKTIQLCEAFRSVTLVGTSLSSRSISDLLGRRSHIQSLTFENCQFTYGNSTLVRVSSERWRSVILNNSLSLFSLVDNFPKNLESFECNDLLSEDQLKKLENPSFGAQLKCLKLWRPFFSNLNFNNNIGSFKYVLKIEHMSELTSLTIPELNSVRSIPDSVKHLSLCNCQQETLRDVINKPLSHISSLTIYQLSLKPGLPLSTLIKAFCTAFPNLKYLTLPESILHNSKANIDEKSSPHLLDSSQDQSLAEPSELCKITILHSEEAWPMFVNGLLYELNLSFPRCRFKTCLELVAVGNESDCFHRSNSVIPWNTLSKNENIVAKTIQLRYFEKIHTWYQLYHDNPDMRNRIDEMRQDLIKLCAFKNIDASKQHQLSEIMLNLNIKVFDFERMKVFLKDIIDLRRKQLNIFFNFVSSHNFAVFDKASCIVHELETLQDNSEEMINISLNRNNVNSDDIFERIEELANCVKEMENILLNILYATATLAGK